MLNIDYILPPNQNHLLCRTKCKMIFLTSRKIYRLGDNLNELSKLKPNCNYSKNKLKTEKKLLKKLKNRILILRISNLIGVNNSFSSFFEPSAQL